MSELKLADATEHKKSLKELEAEVELNRQRFGDSVSSLRDKVEDISDWRHWVQQAPWKSVFGCVAVGWILGRITSRR